MTPLSQRRFPSPLMILTFMLDPLLGIFLVSSRLVSSHSLFSVFLPAKSRPQFVLTLGRTCYVACLFG